MEAEGQAAGGHPLSWEPNPRRRKEKGTRDAGMNSNVCGRRKVGPEGLREGAEKLEDPPATGSLWPRPGRVPLNTEMPARLCDDPEDGRERRPQRRQQHSLVLLGDGPTKLETEAQKAPEEGVLGRLWGCDALPAAIRKSSSS